ncbi:polysaccharide lyase family 7 protein [Amycolatopsis sp. NPDC005961]|uniref:polysaccharide lyase family 7 protein n=1 Tax=Amycolatopsis sp. NPDC005961 TaxID=3156720 RepID=UPI0033BFBC96
MRTMKIAALTFSLAAVCAPVAHAAGAPVLAVAAVSASGDDGHVPAASLDGDLGTRWSAEGDGAWIEYDLGSAQTVGSVALAWYQGDARVFTFDVQVSGDGSAWATVLSRHASSGRTADFEAADFADTAGRYVRIVGHGNTKNDWTSIAEAHVLGADGGSGGSCAYPADVLDLRNWYEGLPTGQAEDPTVVKQPQLATFKADPWFVPTADCAGVRFRAAVDGVTTSGSGYPRSELRETKGADLASWSSTSGTSTMTIREAITHLPAGKPQVVAGQIHGSSDDITVFRLEGSNLYVTKGDDAHYKLITGGYQLGTVFEAKFVVSGGAVKAYYNGTLVTTISQKFSGAYFKAGAYTQANCGNSSPCSAGNYGEVVIHDLVVTHT